MPKDTETDDLTNKLTANAETLMIIAVRAINNHDYLTVRRIADFIEGGEYFDEDVLTGMQAPEIKDIPTTIAGVDFSEELEALSKLSVIK